MNFKSVLKPENSIIAGIATIGLVYAIYQMNVGPLSQAHASDPNHPALETSRKKAGYTAFIAVSGITLIAKDANIGILGFLTIIAEEIQIRHAIMVEPNSGRMVPPAESAFSPAENVVPITQQAANVGVGY